MDNFHGFTFGYRIPTKVMYDAMLDKADDELYDYLIEHTWAIDNHVRILGVDILITDDTAANAVYDISEINKILNNKAKDVDDFLKRVSDTIRIYNDFTIVPLLPQLYYVEVTL